MSDALEIAKFCWPEQPWKDDADSAYTDEDDAEGYTYSFWGTRLDDDDDVEYQIRRHGVASAERILVERGMAQEYALALLAHLHLLHKHDEGWLIEEDVVKIAMAPAEARVRAMLAVIRAAKASARG